MIQRRLERVSVAYHHHYYFSLLLLLLLLLFFFFFFLENSSIFLKLSSTFMGPSPVFTPVYFNVSDVKYV